MNYDLFPELPTPKNNYSLRFDRISPRNIWTHPNFPYKTTEGINEIEQNIRIMVGDSRFIFTTIKEKYRRINTFLDLFTESPNYNDYLYWVKDQLKYLPSIESFCKEQHIDPIFDDIMVKDYLDYKGCIIQKIQRGVTVANWIMISSFFVGSLIGPILFYFGGIDIVLSIIISIISVFFTGLVLKFYKKGLQKRVLLQVEKNNTVIDCYTQKLKNYFEFLRELSSQRKKQYIEEKEQELANLFVNGDRFVWKELKNAFPDYYLSTSLINTYVNNSSFLEKVFSTIKEKETCDRIDEKTISETVKELDGHLDKSSIQQIAKVISWSICTNIHNS